MIIPDYSLLIFSHITYTIFALTKNVLTYIVYNITMTSNKEKIIAPGVTITLEKFLEDIQGRRFSDVVNDPEQSFVHVLEFFNNENRQRRMEEAEIHHDRPPLSGVVRELESHPAIDRSLSDIQTQRSKRLRQAIGVVVRMIMQSRGWQKTGRKGSLGVRNTKNQPGINHNSGGLAFWFIRAERYELVEGMPYRSVRERCQ